VITREEVRRTIEWLNLGSTDPIEMEYEDVVAASS
jgi:hypothetical protein